MKLNKVMTLPDGIQYLAPQQVIASCDYHKDDKERSLFAIIDSCDISRGFNLFILNIRSGIWTKFDKNQLVILF